MQPALAATTQLRVLVAEDNPLNQLFAARLMEKQGHLVYVASNGQQALDLVLREALDVVLMDVGMPVMDGYDAVRKLRQLEQHSGSHLPVIAVSANTTPSDRGQCLAAGMDDFVGKPIREAELLGAISRVFRNRPQASPVNKSTHTQEAACDLAAALQKLCGDTAFLQQLIEVFLATVPNHIESLNAAMKARDRDLTSDMAHAIKGTVRYFCAAPAYNAAQQLEVISRSGLTPEVDTTYEHLLSEIERLRTDLQHASLPISVLVT